MNSQQLIHFKQKLINDFLKVNYEHFTMENTNTPEPNDTDNVDVSLLTETETTETIDTDPHVDVEAVSESLTPLPVMSTTEIDDDISYINTRRHGTGRYLA